LNAFPAVRRRLVGIDPLICGWGENRRCPRTFRSSTSAIGAIPLPPNKIPGCASGAPPSRGHEFEPRATCSSLQSWACTPLTERKCISLTDYTHRSGRKVLEIALWATCGRGLSGPRKRNSDFPPIVDCDRHNGEASLSCVLCPYSDAPRPPPCRPSAPPRTRCS